MMTCRLCQSDNLKLYYQQGNQKQYKFYQCRNCKLVNYDLTSGLNQGKYGQRVIDPFDKKAKKNQDLDATYCYIKKKQQKLKIVPGRMLDIGCSNGRLLYLARQDGWQVHGIELSELNAQSVRDNLNIPVHTVNFLDHQIDDDHFDFVILRHVLEHLVDPMLAMEKISQLTHARSYILLEFPNIEAWDFKGKRLMDNLGLRRKRYAQDYKPGHCHEYCRHSFQFLLQKTGFRLLDWQTYASNRFQDMLFQRISIGSKARALICKQ